MKFVKVALMALSVALASGAQASSPAPSGSLDVSIIDHVGMNVPDVDAAIQFFADLAGAKVISDIRPGAIPAEWKTQFHWRQSSELERFAMVQLKGGAKVELFQYRGPDINPEHPYEDDAGASHVALKTNDIAGSLALIKSKGLKVLNEPITNPDGVQWFYFLTPWGSQMELVSIAKK